MSASAAMLEVPTSFIGRDDDRRDVKRALSEHRVATIVGVGGAGKTRLAIEVVRDVRGSYPDGVWVVPLAGVSDPSLVAEAVARAVEAPPGADPTEAVIAAIGAGSVLLVLDNCEHVLSHAARLVRDLVAGCPALAVLATSREALHVPGEAVHPLEPMRVPPADVTAEALPRYDAARLFLDRAQAANPAFALDEDDVPYVASICRRLDGIPLAIELAAARARVLSPKDTDARLGERFALLRAREEQAVAHHQTLRAAIEWSVALLDEHERALLSRLAAFGGSFDLAAAEEVAGAPPLARSDVVDVLERLVERSLVVAERHGSGMRFRQLETIRAYGREMLEAAGEDELTGRRLLEHLVALVHLAHDASRTPRQAGWFQRFELEHDNIRAALAWAERHAPVDDVLPLLHNLYEFWRAHGHIAEGRAWISRLLDGWRGTWNGDLAMAHLGSGVLAEVHADLDGAMAAYERSLAVAREIGDPVLIATALKDIAGMHADRGDLTAMRTATEESLELFRAAGAPWGIGATLVSLGNIAFHEGRIADAEANYHEALILMREREDERAAAQIIANLAETAWRRSDAQEARRRHEEALAIRRDLGERAFVASSLRNYGDFLCEAGDRAAGIASLREALLLASDHGAADVVIEAILSFALAAGDDPPRAAVLAAAARGLYAASGYAPQPLEARRLEALERHVRSQLDEDTFARAVARGSAMTRDDAVAFALAEPADAENVVTFRPDGEAWTIQRGSRAVRLRDVKGLRYLHALLRAPGTEITAISLAAGSPSAELPRDGGTGPVLDDDAKAAYRERLGDLMREREEAEAWNDAARAARAREEAEALERELATAVGLGGRDRVAGSDAERARQTVTKAIKAAIERIGRHDPELAAHLGASVRTGIYCMYEPGGETPFAWRV